MSKKIILILLSLLIFNISQAQDAKKKTNSNSGMKEIYFQKKIKGIGKVKDGYYEKYHKSNYYPDILIKKGQYKNNKEIGIWTFYNTERDSIFAFNFDDDKVEFINTNAKRIVKRYRKFYSKQSQTKYATSYIYSVKFDEDDIISHNFSRPIFILGDSEFYDIMFASIMKAIEYNEYNTYNFSSLIKLKINKEGILDDINIVFSSDPRINKVKNDLLKQNLKWIPRYENSMPIDYELSIPVFCNSIDNNSGYNFELSFCRQELLGDQIPSCDEWPLGLGGNAKMWVWIRNK